MQSKFFVSLIIVIAFVVILILLLSSRKNVPSDMVNDSMQEEVMSEDTQTPEQETMSPVEAAPSQAEAAPEMTIIKAGTGDRVTVAGDTLSVIYTGTFTNGTVFDSNKESGTPFEFTLGAGHVISGWDIGLVGMKVGEVRKLVLPPAFAYGSQAVGPIPANSTLVFEVELKAIK